MYRCIAAFLILAVSMPLDAASADAKAAVTPAPKRITVQKPAAKKAEQQQAKASTQAAQSGEIQTMVREQSAVIEPDSAFTAPEGALYTTSDECG